MTYPLLIAEPPFQVLPALAQAVGFNEAAVLQVIHYWLNPQDNNHFREGRHWVPNVFNQLYQRFFFWDADTIEYMIAQLEQSGILIAYQESSEIKYHTIDYELLKGGDGAPIQLVPVTPFIQDILPKANQDRRPSFRVEVQMKGSDLYTMVAQDLAHFLECELILEIKDNTPKQQKAGGDQTQGALRSREVVCDFPRIVEEQFRKFVWDDVTLYGILMVMFQMKIMEQLLLFCATHKASNLIIFADDDQDKKLGIYRDFLKYLNQPPTTKGGKEEMIIPADQKAFEAWLDFMAEVTIKFRQTLWKGQKTNPAIQHYLKSQQLSEI